MNSAIRPITLSARMRPERRSAWPLIGAALLFSATMLWTESASASCGSHLHSRHADAIADAILNAKSQTPVRETTSHPGLPCHGPRCREQGPLPSAPAPLPPSTVRDVWALPVAIVASDSQPLVTWLLDEANELAEGNPSTIDRPPRTLS